MTRGRGKRGNVPPSTKRRDSKLPAWDLSDLYSGIEDKRISKHVQEAKRDASRFHKRYHGKVLSKAKKKQSLLEILKEYEGISRKCSKPAIYAGLIISDSALDPKRGAFLQRMQTESTVISNLLTFFPLELAELSSKQQKEILQSKSFAPYKNYLKKLFESKKHILPEEQEHVFSDKRLTGAGAFVRLYNEEFAHRKYTATFGKKTTEFTLTDLLDRLHSPDRDIRKAASEGLSEGLKQDSRRLAFIYNTLIVDKAINDRYRNYPTPEASRHRDNQIDQETVDVMTKTVVSSYKHVQNYYAFKKKALGFKTMYEFDRYAPVGGSDKRVSFDEARAMILEAFGHFSPVMRETAQMFFDQGWIDAADRPGKRSGAFCSYVTEDLHPYVFVNYTGTLREVFTLAHELGHGIHACLMRKQTHLSFDTPLTTAETASVFAELLLFESLKKKIKSPRELYSLYATKIESIFATIHRQISMFLFERDAHDAVRTHGEQTVEQFNTFWRNRQREMFRNSVELTHNYDYWWAYIPHFMHTPFYVYAYAFGELLTLALYQRYLDKPEGFEQKYIEFLSAGDSRSPLELIRSLGVNPKDPKFWKNGVIVIEHMIGEMKRTHARM
ncbi:MAG: M3 family oligoendopeptidase [Bdellovibrionales bacterium]|nr:M3 family oligoendopeptidase [Bdellovibrionales bacterium]